MHRNFDEIVTFQPLTFEMYESRVKGIHYQNDHLASISSNGDITVWTVDINEKKITELCTTNIGCRPICLAIINLADFADEYILKRESEDEEKVAEKIARESRAETSRKLGKVVIENDDDEDVEDVKKSKVKKSKDKVWKRMRCH